MAITKLPTNFIDAVTETKKYQLTDTDDGQVLITDVSEYTELGSYFGAVEINSQHSTINQIIDNQDTNQSVLDKVMDGTTVFDHVDHADTVAYVTEVTHASSADSATSVDETPQAVTTDTADYAPYADLADVVDYAPKADSTPEIASVSVADTAETATTATYATKLSGGKINNVTFNGTKNITVYDDTKFPKSSAFILASKEELTFTDKVCTITDSRITSNSLAEVSFTSDCIDEAKKAGIVVDTSSSTLTITAARTPTSTLTATIFIRVV